MIQFALLNLLLFVLNFAKAYHIYFYRGSFIDKIMYSNFLRELQAKLPNSNVEYQDYVTWKEFPKDTILIGHSFGGFVSLLHTMNHPENVKACVLLNSHFNHNTQMPYLCVSMHKIQQPVLCIFTDMDEQLPCEKVFQDWEIAVTNKMDNKIFDFYVGTHFSMFTHREQIDRVSDRIVKFIKQIEKNDENKHQ